MGNTESFGAKLKRIRKAAGYSAVGLATLSQINPQTLKDIEAGRSEAGIKSLTGISKALNLSIEDLLSGTTSEKNISPAPKKLTPNKVLKMFLSIPEDVVEMAEELGPSHPVWEIVRGAYDQKVKSNQLKKSKKDPA